MLKTSKQFFKRGNKVLKITVVILAFVFLVYQLFFKENILNQFENLKNSIHSTSFITYFIIALLLMPINWLVEALKWRFIISKKEKLSISLAYKAIFAGISIASITPNRIGEYFARLFVLKKTRFWEGVFMTIIGSFSQTIITLSLGMFSIFLFLKSFPYCLKSYVSDIPIAFTFNIIFIISLIIFYILYFKISWFVNFIPYTWKRIRIYSKILKIFTGKELLIVLIFSAFRYLIFSTQFVLILNALDVKIPVFDSFLLVSIIFLLNTISPSIALLELGVRGSISIFIIQFYFENLMHQSFHSEIEVLLSSSLTWLINIVLPAFIGLFFVNNLDFFRVKLERHNE